MKILDGNYKNIMVTNSIMNQIEKELADNIIFKIEDCNFEFDFENRRIMDEWISRINVDELCHLKLYGDYFGYEKLAEMINNTIEYVFV